MRPGTVLPWPSSCPCPHALCARAHYVRLCRRPRPSCRRARTQRRRWQRMRGRRRRMTTCEPSLAADLDTLTAVPTLRPDGLGSWLGCRSTSATHWRGTLYAAASHLPCAHCRARRTAGPTAACSSAWAPICFAELGFDWLLLKLSHSAHCAGPCRPAAHPRLHSSCPSRSFTSTSSCTILLPPPCPTPLPHLTCLCAASPL